MIRIAAILVLLCAPAAEQARTAEEHQARLAAWAEPLAEKLMAALPEPLEGLAPFAPWDYEFNEPPGWGCPVGGCTQLTQVEVQRKYVVYEPELGTRADAVAAKALANATRIVSNPSDQKLQAAQEALELEEETLRKSVRRFTIDILVNGEGAIRRGVEGAPTRAGTVGSYPVTRFAFNDPSYHPTPAGVRLAIVIGPEGFKNPRVKDNSVMQTEARTAVISVSAQSRTATLAADEATARKLLENIDVEAIAKLLK
ncbi:MAG TPA: hypothetical protein VNT81_04170 [Vicinamibacterales bacterium]|nr:hypothetical protein [Vicinamibacterales bacterium]